MNGVCDENVFSYSSWCVFGGVVMANMRERDEYYDGEERGGALVGIVVLMAMFTLVLVLICLSMLVAVGVV